MENAAIVDVNQEPILSENNIERIEQHPTEQSINVTLPVFPNQVYHSIQNLVPASQQVHVFDNRGHHGGQQERENLRSDQFHQSFHQVDNLEDLTVSLTEEEIEKRKNKEILVNQLIEFVDIRQNVKLKRKRQEYENSDKNDVKQRNRFNNSEKLVLIGIFDLYDESEAALGIINSFEGFEKVSKSIIMNWKRKMESTAISTKKMGRPFDPTFEEEVMKEFHSVRNSGVVENKPDIDILDPSTYSYVLVRDCAEIVRDRCYVDENTSTQVYKWKENKLTKDLKFSTKWISNLLKRHTDQLREHHNQTQSSPLQGELQVEATGVTHSDSSQD